jgi:hypothetical protein
MWGALLIDEMASARTDVARSENGRLLPQIINKANNDSKGKVMVRKGRIFFLNIVESMIFSNEKYSFSLNSNWGR